MAAGEDKDPAVEEEFQVVIGRLEKELNDLYHYRDYFFELNPIEMACNKNKLIVAKQEVLIEKFNEIDETELSIQDRSNFLFLKGKVYNIASQYDARASQCLSKAIKLNPKLVEAWNELGECYWKNKNIKDAKHSFEGGMKIEKSKVALRCLSIIHRQDIMTHTGDNLFAVTESVNFAKEAVSLDYKDGTSWCVLGNAYMCQYFLVSQEPNTLKACMSAYKQAELDPVARGQPDLFYNKAMALKYDENYVESLMDFERACKLDPEWNVVHDEKNKLVTYVNSVSELIKTKGKIKNKKLQQMIQTLDIKLLGPFGLTDKVHTFGKRRDVKVDRCRIDELKEGINEGKVILGRVIGSVYTENVVPFTFALIDASMECTCVTVYNWADGKGVIIGDSVAIPEPVLRHQRFTYNDTEYSFKTIRVNNPTVMWVNGKQVSKMQFAGPRISSTYELVH